MNFYNLLQLNPDKIKEMAKESSTVGGKIYYGFTVTFRAVIIVAFCILFCTILNTLFGEENSALSVVLVILVLMLRFVNFGYRIQDTLVTFAAALAILVFAPSLALSLPAVPAFFVHLIAIFALMSIACQEPRMGFAGLFGFAYVYLVGNSVQGAALVQRAGMGLVGYLICAAILIYHHRKKNTDVHFLDLLRGFRFTKRVNLWQIRGALGLALLLTAAIALDVPRFTWMGFACSTLLMQFPCSGDVHSRFIERVQGAVVGSALFFLLCQLIPESALTIVGLLGGVALGFCSDYRWKTIVICFGALSIAAGIYGILDATLIRICNNVIGALFGLIFAWLFDRLIVRRLAPEA